MKYLALIVILSCGGWPPAGNPTFADALVTNNFSDYNRNGLVLDETECSCYTCCPNGERCFWNWDSNKNVCLMQGGSHSAGCRLGGNDCEPGLFCIDPERPDAGSGVGCCSTFSDRCS